MAEKGQNGFPTSRFKTRASKPKKSAALKGKDDILKERKAQFDMSSDSEDFEESPRANTNVSGKSGAKVSFDTPVSKGDFGKGGKGGKGDKSGVAGGKGSESKELIIPKFEIQAELPKNASCLMDCEAEVILHGIQDHLTVLSEDPMIKIPGAFHKGLQYAQSGCYHTNTQSGRRVLETLKRHHISDDEICLIGNICPETDDELFALMPSLKENRVRTGRAINDVISELTKLKSSK